MGKFKDVEFLGELGTLTQSILEDNERAARVGAPAAPYINRYILEIAAGVSMKNYHPAARVNATLLLALLDDAPENPSDKKPPTPSATALKPLVQLYSTEPYQTACVRLRCMGSRGMFRWGPLRILNSKRSS